MPLPSSLGQLLRTEADTLLITTIVDIRLRRSVPVEGKGETTSETASV